MKDGQQARRLNDKEVQKAATEVSKGADQYKKALDSSLKKDKSIDAATRQALVAEADGLKEDAKRLASTIGDGRPASGEAQAVVARAAKVKDASSGRQLSPAESSAWAAVASALDKVAQGFGK
jgi:hypothetical protein